MIMTMNKIFKFIGVAVAAVALSSCVGDNYKAPDSSLYGQAIDMETGEIILQDIGSQGSQIDIIEESYGPNASVRTLNFKTDGSYRENNMFQGTYRISTARANFMPIDTTVVKVKGETKFNIRAVPYCRIEVEDVIADEAKHTVVFKFTVEAVTDVKTLRLFCDSNKNVSASMNNAGDNTCLINVGTAVSPDHVYTLKMSTDALENDKDYYFRVGALSSANEAKYNYAPTEKIHIVKQPKEDVPQPGICIDYCDDDTDGWIVKTNITLSLDVKDFIYGAGSLKAVSAAAGVSQFFRKVYSEPIDASSIPMDKAYLRLRLYCDKPGNLPANAAGQIELTSGGAPDVQELAWTFDKFKYDSGWNVLYLPLASAAKTGGDFNIANINCFRIYHASDAGNTTLKLDEIRILNIDDVEDDE